MPKFSTQFTQHTTIVERLASYLENNQRFLLVAPPAIGKTGMITSATQLLEYDIEIMRVSLKERIDFGGCLVPDFEKNVTRALLLDTMHSLKNATKPTVLFLDDIGQAPLDVQSALMQPLDKGWLPACVRVCGATNEAKHGAASNGMNETLRSRFGKKFNIPTPQNPVETPTGGCMLGCWTDMVKGWCNWAVDAGMPAEVIAYIRKDAGANLYKWQKNADIAIGMADFRGWEDVGISYNLGYRDLSSFGSTIGKPTASDFLAFTALASEMPSLDEIRSDPMNARIPDSSGGKYMIATMLEMSATLADVRPFAKYAARMNAIYGALVFWGIHRKPGFAIKLSSDPTWMDWSAIHNPMFTGQTS